MFLHRVQLAPVPKYRFFCLSARDTMCPIRCDVEILMAPGGKPSCLTTLPAVRHCQSQCEPGDSQTHLQSDAEGLPGKLVVSGVDASAHTAWGPPHVWPSW